METLRITDLHKLRSIPCIDFFDLFARCVIIIFHFKGMPIDCVRQDGCSLTAADEELLPAVDLKFLYLILRCQCENLVHIAVTGAVLTDRKVHLPSPL